MPAAPKGKMSSRSKASGAGTRPPAQWTVADAKARLSQLVEEAGQAPQTITRNGKPVAVMVGIEEWKRKAARKGSLSEFFQTAPEGFADLDFARSSEIARDIKL